jgi:hypothetical protein
LGHPEPFFLNNMNIKKAILLFLALLLPIFVFIFLKFFGKNEFDVPAFYQEEKPVVAAACSYAYDVPYLIPDSVMGMIKSSGAKPLYMVNFSAVPEISRVAEAYGDEIATINGSVLNAKPAVLKSCVFAMKDFQDIVLIDDQRKIRGYYTSTDREDIDRLLLELDILLKKY